MIAGSALCVFYLVATRYFPRLRRRPTSACRRCRTRSQAPRWSTSPRPCRRRTRSTPWSPLATIRWPSKVGWFGLNNINCGMLGAPLGFLIIYVVSHFTKAPSAEMMGFIDEIRKPRGNTVLEEKTT